jgi:signal transduction histidine kinase
MKIILVSDDQYFRKLCHDVLVDLPSRDWELATLTLDECPAGADLYIWDDNGRTAPPPEFHRTASKHLFATTPEALAGRGAEEPSTYAGVILLKPVSRACLSAFLHMAISAQDRGTAQSFQAERDEILQYLMQANLQIQKYDQERTNFLARLVHDFRTPLMTASGYCGLLLGEAMGLETERQKEVLRRIQHSINRLSRMSEALFDLSAGRRVKRAPELGRGDIRACMEQALHEVTPFADDKRISITTEMQAESGPLLMDEGQIEQVLVNLLENACKFTPKCGTLDIKGAPYFWERRCNTSKPGIDERRVRRSREPNSYRVDIRDSGLHIAEEQLTKIFEEYTSYGGGGDRSGGGLGLAICRMILHAHGGRVWAENSEAGPVFSFVLPIRTEQGSAAHSNGFEGRETAAHAGLVSRTHHQIDGPPYRTVL